jgi:hypothetical protein
VSDGRELQRQLAQDHLDLRAARETRLLEVRDADGVAHNALEPGHRRALATVVGTVQVSRVAYRAAKRPNLHPADAVLNLPRERYSFGLRQLAALESTRGSYEEATSAIERSTGVVVAKRQVEELTVRAAEDVESFYSTQPHPSAKTTDILVISADGKGIVMRPEALREATARAARSKKLKTRLSKGEKSSKKRMAELAVVHDATPVVREPSDIFADETTGRAAPGPVATGKWLTASVVNDAASVIASAFDEAERRDPAHARTWVGLVDGNSHQISRIKAEARKRRVQVTIVVDFIHVLTYLWASAWSFFAEGDPAAEAWVREKALAVLEGKAGIVAGSIRRKATALQLSTTKRKKADECARYLLAKKAYLDYPTALAKGWPIATGVIEGACRHLVRDRFDITGARWGLEGAEAVLKLRAVRSNGDWAAYWTHHRAEERRRVHEGVYLDGIVPRAA